MQETVNNDPPGMFIPEQYRASDPRALIRRFPFALLVSWSEQGPYATPLPLYFETDDPEEAHLIGHMARRNPQAGALEDTATALAVFQGPHAYISASWYKEKPQVPTWNYISAQVRGDIEVLRTESERLAVLERTVDIMEQESPAPWGFEQAPEGMMDALLPLIQAFRLRITRLDAATKLNQAHPPGDRSRVIRHLLLQNECNSLEIARWMAGLDYD